MYEVVDAYDITKIKNSYFINDILGISLIVEFDYDISNFKNDFFTLIDNYTTFLSRSKQYKQIVIDGHNLYYKFIKNKEKLFLINNKIYKSFYRYNEENFYKLDINDINYVESIYKDNKLISKEQYLYISYRTRHVFTYFFK